MPYDEELAERVRRALAGTHGLAEKKMFGGIAFLIGGALCIGVSQKDLIIRCDKEETDQFLEKAGVRIFDRSGGRPMKGWLLVGPEATRTAAGFKSWIAHALAWTTKADQPAPRPRPRSSARK
ncbi:MAG TPA: TfoX/Sxy family protein [Polyangiaceae bacterium]|nr:TfoX/Sxy family protein [Polyangiaceae bacterium]